MFRHLQIYEPRERLLVGLADWSIRPFAWFRSTPRSATIRRVLLMRLERIGDLLMVLDAIRDARAAWPEAEIDLAVGSWNLPIATLIPGLARVETADAPWLARGNANVSNAALDPSSPAVADATLRPRRQLRARHPQQLSRVAHGRAAALWLLDGRRRRIPHRRLGLHAGCTRQRQRPATDRARGWIARLRGRTRRCITG